MTLRTGFEVQLPALIPARPEVPTTLTRKTSEEFCHHSSILFLTRKEIKRDNEERREETTNKKKTFLLFGFFHTFSISVTIRFCVDVSILVSDSLSVYILFVCECLSKFLFIYLSLCRSIIAS